MAISFFAAGAGHAAPVFVEPTARRTCPFRLQYLNNLTMKLRDLTEMTWRLLNFMEHKSLTFGDFVVHYLVLINEPAPASAA
jgi:hypothetical protein